MYMYMYTCLTCCLFASFFLPSHFSLKHVHTCTCTCMCKLIHGNGNMCAALTDVCSWSIFSTYSYMYLKHVHVYLHVYTMYMYTYALVCSALAQGVQTDASNTLDYKMCTEGKCYSVHLYVHVRYVHRYTCTLYM